MTARVEEAAMEAQKQHKIQVSRLDESLVAAQTRAEQVEAELSMSIQKVQGGLEGEVAKLQKQVAELKAHDADACAKVLRIEGEIADKEEERMRLCEVVEEQEAKRQDAEQEAVSLKQKLEEAETVCQVKEREMRAIKAKCDELEKERAASMEELENLEGQMARTLDSMQALINSKDREVAELREELEGACEAQVCVEAQQDAARDLQDQLSSSEQARLDLEGRLLDEAERIKGLCSENEHLEGLLTAAAESVYAEQVP
jgi:chromosome segregation ATPase